MKKYSFVKMNGAGNDFIAFDRDENPGLVLSAEFIQKVCNRYFGVGGDGVITVARTPGADFAMEYYNADGSTGSLCGNGARCAIRFAKKKKKFSSSQVKFICLNEVYEGCVLSDDEVRFSLKNPTKLKLNFPLSVGDKTVNAHFIDTGSPHVVIDVAEFGNGTELGSFDVAGIGRKIRYHQMFSPGGTNVNFLTIQNDIVHLRTYERGVEAETLACGTGATAAACIAYLTAHVKSPVTIIPTSGKKLVVDFTVDGDTVSHVSLAGPADINFAGEIEN
jgi:diaminopimelate epimerase